MYAKLLQNHTLTNLAFALVLVMGWLTYYQMPREQDPSINFNFVQIATLWPGASATDVETRVTEPLEDGLEKVEDVKFISSSSREGISIVTVRFNELDEDQFETRMSDLRREVQNKLAELPEEAKRPEIFEISSSNAFPTGTLAVVGMADDERLRKAAHNIRQDLERMRGVDRIDAAGYTEPELHVYFSPSQLIGLGVSPVDLADTVKAYFRDLAAGSLSLGEQEWGVRLSGTSSDPRYLGGLPIVTARGELPLRSVADVMRGHEDARQLVDYQGDPAILLFVFKKDRANNLDLLDRLRTYIGERNLHSANTGIKLVLLDDQTIATRQAIGVMERNALIGLVLVLLMAWLFLGFKIALFTSLGITFVLAGTFWLLGATGHTLNGTVLLGIVISLGMLVDDSVVIVEAIYYRMQKGLQGIRAVLAALSEVAAPVSTAVLTTIAAFLPLMLIPGVLGDFMRVVPVVVSLALLISLVEAYWMLPSHILEWRPDLTRPSKAQRIREKITARIRRSYARKLIFLLRRPKLGYILTALLLVAVLGMLFRGVVRVDFFASDLFRLFYVNVEMPPGTSLEYTLKTVRDIEREIRSGLKPEEVRAIVSYAGQRFTEKEALFGDEKGQVFVSLRPHTGGRRGVSEIIASLRGAVESVPGPIAVSFLRRQTGPPTSKPVSIKVRGDRLSEIRGAAAELKQIIDQVPGTIDISDDDTKGRMELSVRLNADAITRAGLDPADVVRIVRLYVDGESVASMQYLGEKLDVRVRARPESMQDIDGFLGHTVGLPDGNEIALGELLDHETYRATNNVHRYNLRRSITVDADLDPSVTDTLTVNREIKQAWEVLAGRFPGVDLDFSGEMDDIQESINAMALLFLMGMGLIYLILGTLFKSYTQPLLILTTVPMAFIGVVLGLFISGNPLSLYTLYGVIALAGIAANDAIVLISTANRLQASGWPVSRCILYAARRRVIPILITSLTTMAGLFSLAAGLGGESLMWSPVATAIVWGLGFSTVLTLSITSLLYNTLFKPSREEVQTLPLPPSLNGRAESLYSRLLRSLTLLTGKPARKTGPSPEPKQFTRRQAELYIRGSRAMQDGRLEEAIRCFQRLAEEAPEKKLFNIYAAQAHVLYMQKHGWDIGYDARARRYLHRSQALGPPDPREKVMQDIIARLNAAEAAPQQR